MSDEDSLIPYEALRREVAAAISWPIDLVVWEGESFGQIGPGEDGQIHGLVTLDSHDEHQGGIGEDSKNTYTSTDRTRTVAGKRMLKLEIKIEHIGQFAADLASKVERRMQGEGVLQRLLEPSGGEPPISLLAFNTIDNVPFTANGHVLTAALVEIDAMVGYEEADVSASPDYFTSATATRGDG